jgi:hypothetical protein
MQSNVPMQLYCAGIYVHTAQVYATG